MSGPEVVLTVEEDGRCSTIEPAYDDDRVAFPFLASLPGTVFAPAALTTADGRPAVRAAGWSLPVVRLDNGRAMTLLGGPELSSSAVLALSRGGWVQAPASPVRMRLVVHDGGWPAAFARLRTAMRAGIDLGQHEREDLEWYRDQLVQHFTFLYGAEVLDLGAGRFDVDRLLDDGERRFGGYDGVLVWAAYPRLGIDQRTQWDLYDDLPGGRPGLRALGERCRARGARLFVPYKPWDGPGDEHAAELARLVADVDADGVFLDTMSAVDPELKAAVDAARPGVALCGEGRAAGSALETIAGSWDQETPDLAAGNQSASEPGLPGVDVRRFAFPEHPLFVASRHAGGADRMRAIKRGFFNGTGWVVWQDVFGLFLAYTPEEAELLRACRTVAREHLDALRSPMPTPLVDTLAGGVWANHFPAEHKQLWTLCNASDAAVSGPVLAVDVPDGWALWDAWRRCPVEVDDAGRVWLELEPEGVGALVARPAAC